MPEIKGPGAALPPEALGGPAPSYSSWCSRNPWRSWLGDKSLQCLPAQLQGLFASGCLTPDTELGPLLAQQDLLTSARPTLTGSRGWNLNIAFGDAYLTTTHNRQTSSGRAPPWGELPPFSAVPQLILCPSLHESITVLGSQVSPRCLPTQNLRLAPYLEMASL